MQSRLSSRELSASYLAQRVENWARRNPQYSAEWRVHLQDEEDCRGDRHRAKGQRCDYGGVGRGKKTEAGKDGGQPRDHDHQKWKWNGILLRLEEQ